MVKIAAIERKRGSGMTNEDIKKVLSQCSKEMLVEYLAMQHNAEHIVRKIALYEFDKKSKEILDEVDKLNQQASETRDRIEFMKMHNKSNEKYKELDKLEKWINSI